MAGWPFSAGLPLMTLVLVSLLVLCPRVGMLRRWPLRVCGVAAMR